MGVSNPYVGPKPFAKGQPLFGRDREVAELRYLLTAERIVLLYSPSGAGKSSLVQAGLVPQMEKRFDIWGPTRVNTQPPEGAKNRYVWSAIAGLEQSAVHGDMTLAEYAAARPHQRNPLIIFDQFEETIRIESETGDARQEFFRQLGELLSNPQIWALFVLREDYLAPLEPYMDVLPTNLQHRYRLDRLTKEMAKRAIEGPTENGPRKYAPGVVDTLVTNLATVQIQGPDGKPARRIGEYVEPLQLQVVCFDLWERMERDKPQKLVIEAGDIGDVSSALRSYYDNAVRSTAASSDVHDDERAIREWFQHELITPDGLRNQVRHEAVRSGGLETATVKRLLDSYIVRAEPRGGSTWYELAHDRLIEPVRASNQEWLDAHLNWLQKLVALWVLQERPPGRLLIGPELVEAERLASQQPSLTEDEKEFLDRSRKAQADAERAQAAAERERQLSERNHRLFIGASILAVVAVFFAVVALIFWSRANEAKQTAEQRLDQVVQALQKQVASDDTRLVYSGLDQLIGLRTPEEIVEKVTAETVQQNMWLASMVSALDLFDATESNRPWVAKMRVALRQKVARARGIKDPPTPDEDEKLNKRVQIRAGRFLMGSKEPDGFKEEWPQHGVTLSAFKIQEHEVTNKEYWRFAGKPEVKPGENPVPEDEPAVDLSWYDATAYAFWLGGQLPTEAQWEFAARGPEGRAYPWGNENPPTCDRANLRLGPGGCRPLGLQKVKPPREAGKTPEGVFDLVGNVWEWCRDRYAPYPKAGAEESDPVVLTEGYGRVLRGGSFDDGDTLARATYRYYLREEDSRRSLGFRVVF